MFALRLECNRGVLGTADGADRRVLHVDGEQIGPKRAVGHDELGAVPVECAVDGVEVVAGFGCDACGAEIGPGVEVRAGGDADGRVLHAEGGDGVVKVISVADFGDIRCLVQDLLAGAYDQVCLATNPKIIFAVQVNL